MKKDNNSAVSNFFVEIIIVILFFSIASVFIVKIFASSAYNNELNKIRTNACINATSLLEIYKSNVTLEDSIEEILGKEYKLNKTKNGYEIKLNDKMEYKKKGKVLLNVKETLEETSAGVCKTLSLRYIYNRTEIYVIEGKKYEKK